MESIQDVLVGVELKVRTNSVPPGSLTAFKQALAVAREMGAQLTILHSRWHQGEVLPLAPEGQANLEALAQEARAQGVDTEVDITEQRAWLALMRGVAAGADLVVVGKRDTVGIDAAARRIGPVPAKLLRKCPAPVWVVKPDHDLAHKLVLVATDLTAVGDRALQSGARLVRASKGALHVLHAYRVPIQLKLEAAEMSEAEYAERIEALKSEAREALSESLEAQAVSTPSEKVHLSRKSPAVAIREAAEHLAPDLLIMGTLSRGGRPGVQVGETAERLLGRLDCSLLTFKPQGFTSPVVS
ncbi:MAG: universal stress protein E [Planctomycetota bacterium]|jgi:universal stress protein E